MTELLFPSALVINPAHISLRRLICFTFVVENRAIVCKVSSTYLGEGSFQA